MVSPPNFDHEKLDVYRVRESASGLAAPFEHETSELVRQGFLRRFYSQLWMKLSGGLGVL
jgi:hypothetical protein